MSGQKVVVVGQGYVGLPLAIRAAEQGFGVIGFDIDQDRVSGLNAGRSHTDDVSDERLQAVLRHGSYRPEADPQTLAGFDIAVITVPTPLTATQPDLSHVEAAGRTLACHLRAAATVILESTTWPGTTVDLLRPILEEGSGLSAGRDFHLGYSPERIDPGNPVWHFENTPKVVSGIDDLSLERVRSFYDQLVDETIPVPSCGEAEFCKLIENTFRFVNIALINELAMFASDLGVDIWGTIRAASTKPFGFMPFTPGPGVGGHCLPIDPAYLSWRINDRLGVHSRFIEVATDVNDYMPVYVVDRLVRSFNDRELPLKNRRILVLGLSYKRNVGDAREAPAVPICQRLLSLGAQVHAVDPHIGPEDIPAGVTLVDLNETELTQADSVLVLVDHDSFDVDLVRQHARHVFDTRNWLGAGPTVEVL